LAGAIQSAARSGRFSAPSGSETYTYDQMGRVTRLQKVVNATTYTITYGSYNVAGELTSITYPSGSTVRQSFDAIGRLCEVAPQTTGCGTSTSPYANGYSYNPAGQVTGFNYGNGVAASFVYSPGRLQLTSLSYTKGTQTLFSLNYWYKQDSTNCASGTAGNNGQIQCITDSVDAGRTVNYTYDALRRLGTAVTNGSVAYPQWGLAETYDQYGNRPTQTVTAGNGPPSSVTIDPHTNQISGFTYDANGNLTGEPAPNLTNFTYDGEDRLVSYQGPTANAAYIYDDNRLRVRKCLPNCTSPTSSTVYIFSGSKVIAEYDNGAAPASPSREYIYSGAQLLATVTGSGPTATTTYHHADHLSVRVTTDGTTGSPTYGQVIGQQGHFPFGESWYQVNTTTKWFFTSYEHDGESGLDYALARYYDSRVARFCSADPVEGEPDDPQSWNRYAYVRNDPVNLTDPSGEFLNFLIHLIIAIIHAVLSALKFVGHTLLALGHGFGAAQQPCRYPGDCPVVHDGFPWGKVVVGAVGAAAVSVAAQQRPQLKPQQKQPPKPTQTNCVKPNWLQRIGIKAQGWLAKKLGVNVGFGVGGSGGIGHVFGAAGSISRRLVVLPNGSAAFVNNFSATPPPFGLVEGGGVFGGLQFSIGSPATSVEELEAPAFIGSFGGGRGPGAGLDLAYGPSGLEGTLNVGAGAGAEGSGGAALIQTSSVKRICP